jgi:hypothetical protein
MSDLSTALPPATLAEGPLLRPDEAAHLLSVVGVAQRLATTLVATLVAAIARRVVCVRRAVAATLWPDSHLGRLSGRCDGYLVLVELQ